jgi:hypothetical protein
MYDKSIVTMECPIAPVITNPIWRRRIHGRPKYKIVRTQKF